MLTFHLREDFIPDGHSEDGSAYTRPIYTLVAEDEEGARWEHFHVFDDEDRADQFGEAVTARFKEAPYKVLEPKYWTPAAPCYGSVAHQKVGDRHLMTEDELAHNIKQGYIK